MMGSSPKSASFDLEHEDKEAKRRAELRQKHIQLVDNLHRLKAHYQEEYIDGLTEKIKKQRRDIKKKTEEFNKTLQEQERNKKEEARHWLKKRSSRSYLDLDNSFLENLETNKLHKICAVESKLLREGKFRTVEDRDRFWESVKSGGDTRTNTGSARPVGRDGDPERRAPSVSKESNMSEEGGHSTDQGSTAALLGLIREETELSSAPGSRRRPRSIPLQRQKSTASSGLPKKHPKVAAFEEQFKQVEFPRLSAFTLDLELEGQGACHRRLEEGYQQRARLRRHHSRQLDRMYELSLAHLAAAKRMLDKHGDPPAAFAGLGFSNVLDHSQEEDHPEMNLHHEDENISDHLTPSPAETDPNNNDGYVEGNRDEVDHGGTSLFLQTGHGTTLPAVDPGGDEGLTSISHQPLTLDAVMESSPVKEANRSGVLWYNYGKFLPSIET